MRDSLDMEERISTRHPQGKKGVNISKQNYDAMRAAIIDTLAAGDMTHTDLGEGRRAEAPRRL